MFDLTSLCEFSRANCVAICAFLVPLNLLLTIVTMVFAELQRPHLQVRQAALLACIPAVVMVLHVYTWWMIGVIMAPTFILLGLASTCLGINVWATIHSQTLAGVLRPLWKFIIHNS